MDILNDFLEGDREPASLPQLLLMRLIDLLLPAGLLVALLYFKRPPALYAALSGVNTLLLAVVFLLAYRLVSLLLAGATPGMFIARVELLDGHEQPLDARSRLLAAGFVLYRGADYYKRL
ncbi:MAG: hypothetical protein EOO16_13935 [Chitinophagaceae bacterium]|nr:MAG: hypothetical protein EOO16_13935 [Chitinophagaceae bacterium]